jgi:ATP-dependent Clp protease ATP-binding subunit ClpA
VFERFTQSSREIVVAAREEAGRSGHHYLGTEHLLYGLVAERPRAAGDQREDDPAAKVLAGAGLDAAYVRAQTTRLVGSGRDRLGDVEAEALHSIGIDLDAVRSKLEESFGEGVLDATSGAAARGRLPLTARAKKVLGLSLREARRLRHGHLGPEHILLGLIREGHGVAALVIATKVSLPALRDQLMAELEAAA